MRMSWRLLTLAGVAGVTLLLGAVPASAKPPETPATTPMEAEQDPFWATVGIGQIGTKIPPQYLDPGFDWTQTWGPGSDVMSPSSGADGLVVEIVHTNGAGVKMDSVAFHGTKFNDMTITGYLPGDASSTVGGAISTGTAALFSVDPFGYIAGKLADGSVSLLGSVSQGSNQITEPDLTLGWWQSNYNKSFAIGTILWGFMLAWMTYRCARGKIDAHEWVNSMSIWTVAYFGGVTFGPIIAQMLITGMWQLSDGIISQWGSGTGVGTGNSFSNVKSAIVTVSSGTGPGGVVLAVLLLPFVLIAIFAIFISLVLQGAIIYLSSALFAIGFAWVISHRHRRTAWKIPTLFIGIAASNPLMFLLLGMATDIAKAPITGTGTPGSQLTMLVTAVVVFGLAAFSPQLLLKFAAVSPHDMTAAASVRGSDTAPRPALAGAAAGALTGGGAGRGGGPGGGGGGGGTPTGGPASKAAAAVARLAPVTRAIGTSVRRTGVNTANAVS